MTDLTCRQAGRLGGQLVLARHGRDYFRRIGALAPKRDRAYYQAIGRKGGAVTRARYEAAFHESVARAGGVATLARYGRAHFARIARSRHTEARR
jgi:general stress protein YciG